MSKKAIIAISVIAAIVLLCGIAALAVFCPRRLGAHIDLKSIESVEFYYNDRMVKTLNNEEIAEFVKVAEHTSYIPKYHAVKCTSEEYIVIKKADYDITISKYFVAQSNRDKVIRLKLDFDEIYYGFVGEIQDMEPSGGCSKS